MQRGLRRRAGERTNVVRIHGLPCLLACLGAASVAFAQDGPDLDAQISPFVRRIFQDATGDLWLGTNGDGVVRGDGHGLEYFSLDEGFGGVAVRAIVEDHDGNVWFGTDGGITRFDREPPSILPGFTNYTAADGLAGNDVWSMAVDSEGIIWIGTLQGVSRFDGETFTPFVLPEAAPDHARGVTGARLVHCIMEDSRGRMWFGTGGGAYILDGESLTSLSARDGLCSDSVNSIVEGNDGSFWFATHHNGVCRWDGTSFTHVTPEDGVEGTEVWSLFKDSAGHIWFPVEGFGVYRYDGESFTNFSRPDGLASGAIQSIHEDRQGRIWAGGWLGLYRLDGASFVNVTRTGPWQ